MGIIMAIVTASCVGWVFLVGMTFSIGNFETQIVSPAVGVALSQIFYDSCGQGVAIFLILIILGAQFFCGSALTLASSRMVYAFARDGALVSCLIFLHAFIMLTIGAVHRKPELLFFPSCASLTLPFFGFLFLLRNNYPMIANVEDAA